MYLHNVLMLAQLQQELRNFYGESLILFLSNSININDIDVQR